MSQQTLLEKWDPVLKADKVEAISDPYRAKVTATLLENQEKALNEASNTTGGTDNWDPVLISLVRRMAPKLIAYEFCGVQPMTQPTGLVFALRAHYAGTPPATNIQPANKTDNEALFAEANTAYSGTGSHSGDDPWDVGYATGTGLNTATGEASTAWNAMGVTIAKTSVTATTTQLRADYSPELAQDMRSVHGLDADQELANILSTQVISEVNRRVVRTAYGIAKPGAQWSGISTAGTYDLNADADGRWSVERFKGLRFAIERDANAIALETRAGKGNVLVTSSDVASALAMAGVLDYAPALQASTNLEVDAAGVAYSGNMGRFKVFVDPYLGTDGYMVLYKGPNQYDAGFFYCPYVPLQLFRATDVTNFHNAIGFKSRYGMVANPFTTLTANSNTYLRKVKVTSLF